MDSNSPVVSKSMSMDFDNSDHFRRIIRSWLNAEEDFITAEVQIFELKAGFVSVERFLTFREEELHTEKGNLEPLRTGILVGFQNADLELLRLWLDFFIRNSSAYSTWNSMGFFNRTSLEKSLFMPPTNMDGLLSGRPTNMDGLRERLKLLQTDMDQFYCEVSKSSGFNTDMIAVATRAIRQIHEELRIPNFTSPDVFLDFRDRFITCQRHLRSLTGVLEDDIKARFLTGVLEEDINALFPGGPFLSHDLWLLGNGMEFLSFQYKMADDTSLSQMEGKKKMTENKLKMMETNLKMIEPKLEWMCPLRNEVHALRLKVSFLRVFPSSKGKWHTEDRNTKALLTHIHSVSQSLDASLSDTLEKLQLLRLDIQQVYTILSKSSSILVSVTSAKGVMRKLNSLLENMDDLLRCNAELIAPVKEELKAAQKRLRFLRNFLRFTAKRCSKPEELRDLLIHAEFPAVKISCLLYLCFADDKMMKDVEMQLSSELHKLSSAQSREIYVKALKASKSEQGNSTLVDEFDLCFLDSLRDYILELSDTGLSFMTCNKNQILALHEELRFLTLSYAMDKSTEDQMSDNLLERINAAIIDVGCIIYLLQIDEKNRDEGEELKKALSQLQDIVKIAKKDARKAYDIYLPNSLWPKFSKTNAEDFIFFLLKISEELDNMVDSECPLKRHFEVFGNEILSLNEAFNKFIAKQPSHHEKLQIQTTHFSDIEYLIRYVITSFFYRGGTLWIHKLGLFSVIEEIRMITMKLKNLQNKMTHDTSVNAKEKKTTTNNAVIFEDEEGTGEQLTSGSKKLHILSIEGRLKIRDQLRWPETLGLKLSEQNDIQQVYTELFKSSRSISDMNSEVIMENLNFLLEKTEDLLRCNGELIAPIQEELQAIQKSLRFLRNFLGFTTKRCSKLEDLKDLLIQAKFLADNVLCLLYQCPFNDKTNDHMMNKMKSQLLSELQKFNPADPDVGKIYINSLKASKSAERNSILVDEFDLGFLDFLRDFILEISDTKLSVITSNKAQILFLIEELRLITIFFAMDKSLEKHFDQMSNNLLERIIFLIIDVGCVIYSLHNIDQDGDKANDVKIAVCGLQEMVKITKEDARKAYGMYLPKSLWSIFPRVNGQGFLGFLLRNLKELQNTKLKLTGSLFQNADQILVAPFKHYIEVALKELLSLSEEFSKTSKHPDQFEEHQGQWIRFVGIAYQTEYVIDSFLGRDNVPLYHHKLELFDVIEEIKTIKLEFEGIKNKMKDKTSVQKPSCFPSWISLEVNSPKNNVMPRFKERMTDEQTMSKLVIFGKEAEEIKEKLTNGSQKLNFLSIVGMPGIGKTTLADSVFQHFTSTRHFHVLARCSVSQVHDKWRMLREILEQVSSESKQYRDDNDDLEHKLKQNLLGRRYLIFLDDMWDIRPWEDIRACFPDNENGSRIMFTSRSDGIASQAELEGNTYICRLWPLSKDKSWEMLRVKVEVFRSESCPPGLERVGQEIAANCKGLPLMVDLIAGILRATKRETWKEGAESIMSHLLDDPEDPCRNVLELSYKDLPDELKPCFLYFAAFPEDANVPARKLFSLWIAEGFVQQKNDQSSLEDTAEDILNELISRSLVTVSRSRSSGGVKATRVHDLLHEFALIKAREESFMMIIDGKAEKAQWQEQYRLCISDPRVEFHDSSRARAVICFEFGLNLSVFKLLKVLDIPQDCPTIYTLIHLRFLAIGRCKSRSLSEIHRLRNLETFILEKLYGDNRYLLLDKLCNMVRLRHFMVGKYFSLRCSTKKILEKSFLFDNLQTLCALRLSYTEEIEKILKLMPNLVKLQVYFCNKHRKCYPFPKLDFLTKLESLEVRHRDFVYPCKVTSFPPYLKKLVLIGFALPWTEISEIGNFKYLEVLKLQREAFKGPKWDMVDGQFPRLKCLSLYDMDIEEWNPSEDQLSCLEQLHLQFCKNLKELPPCLAESTSLKEIKLSNCSESAVDSAMRIESEKQENGDEILVVIQQNRSRTRKNRI